MKLLVFLAAQPLEPVFGRGPVSAYVKALPAADNLPVCVRGPPILRFGSWQTFLHGFGEGILNQLMRHWGKPVASSRPDGSVSIFGRLCA